MANTNLVIALVFAALFGAALLWLAIYYVHEYIHRRCVELDHWFRKITPPSWRRSCRHCEGTGRDYNLQNEKNRSRSRSRERGSRVTSRTRDVRMIEAGTDWSGSEEPGQIQRPRQVLPTSPAMHGMAEEEQYNPWQSWQTQPGGGRQTGMIYPQQATYLQAYPQMYPQTFQHPYAQASPFMVPRRQPQHTSMPIPESVTTVHTYRKPILRAYKAPSERSQQTVSQAKRKASPRRVHKVLETDYIHMVDEYPPMVQEAIKKKQSAARKACSQSPASSSTSSEPVEEVLRASIPQATPRFADPVPFQSSQYQPTWHAPTSHPREWGDNAGGGGLTEQARYATPYTRPEGRTSREHAERGRHGPSNALP